MAERTKYQRRVVTDGSVFRIQLRAEGNALWTFYIGDYPTREAAQAMLDRWAVEDAAEENRKWEEA